MIPERIYGRFRKHSWITLKHHLFNAHIPNGLLISIREIAMGDKPDWFKQEMLFASVAKIPISKTPNGLSVGGFLRLCGRGTSTHLQATLARYSMVVFMGIMAKTGKRRIKW